MKKLFRPPFNVLLSILAILVSTITYATEPVCCTYQDGVKLYQKELNCSADPAACCRSTVSYAFKQLRLITAASSRCYSVDLLNYSSEVEVCYSPTTFDEVAPLAIGKGLDAFAGLMKIPHAWIRTPYIEAGQGLRPGTPVWTEWADHRNRGVDPEARCYPVANCNVSCVESTITLGKSLGLYGILNTCHDAVTRTLERCGCLNTCRLTKDSQPTKCLEWTWPSLGHRDILKLHRL